MSKPTKGPWRLFAPPKVYGQPMYWEIGPNATTLIAKVYDLSSVWDPGRRTDESEANSAAIVALYNAAYKINPDNPLAVAKGIGEVISVLREAWKEWEPFYDDAAKTLRLVDEDGLRPRNRLETKIIAALAKIEGKGD